MNEPERRHHNDGLRKICQCPRRNWPKCPHAWHMNYKWKGVHYRLSLDREAGKHVDSKTAAESFAEDIRTAIRAGTFRRQVPLPDRLTLEKLFDLYAERCLKVKRPERSAVDRAHARVIFRTSLPVPTGGHRRFGDWLVQDVKRDTLERFREARIAESGGYVSVNRNLGFLQAMWNWAIENDYVESSPFKKGPQTVVRKTKELPRCRRLEDGEEEKLLSACAPHLKAVVIAAIESGCRIGELLSMQWAQVRGVPIAELLLPARKTKTRTVRSVPVSSRLRAVLEMRRTDPDGKEHPSGAYVFGNEIGQRVKSVGTAWDLAVLRAHAITPDRSKTNHALSQECRQALRRINLHIHDPRREAGSRWLEGGIPIHTVRDWLGHTSIAQTDTYLAGTVRTQADAMQRFEALMARRKRAAEKAARRLQQLATKVGKGGRKQELTSEAGPQESNKTGHRREQLAIQ